MEVRNDRHDMGVPVTLDGEEGRGDLDVVANLGVDALRDPVVTVDVPGRTMCFETRP